MESGHNPNFKYTHNYEKADYEIHKNMMLFEEYNYVADKIPSNENKSNVSGIVYDMERDLSNMVLREDGNYYPKRPLPVGVTSFCKAAERYCYVDKTMLIEELLKSGVQVSLFTRPRRFGKTTNMDMLRVFF